MSEAHTPSVGMICRYTDPTGNTYDCQVLEIEGAQAFIKFSPTTPWLYAHTWVNVFTLSVPR